MFPSLYILRLSFDMFANTEPSKTPQTLFSATIKAYKWPLLWGFLPRLALVGLNFSQPFLINTAINLSAEPVNDQTTNIGYGLIGAYALVYIGIAVSYHHL